MKKSVFETFVAVYGRTARAFPRLLRRPLLYTFILTGRCNLRCPYCYQKGPGVQSPWGDSARGDVELPDHVWIAAIEKMGRPAVLCLTGGEPTISKAFVGILAAARKRLIPISVSSNAAMWKDDILELLAAPPVRGISVSLDGFAEVHDTLRNRAGLFENVTDNISRFNVRRNPRKTALTIKTVVTDENLGQLEAFHRFCETELRAQNLNISFLRSGGFQPSFSLQHCADLQALLDRAEATMHAYREPDKLTAVVERLLSHRGPCTVSVFPRVRNAAEARTALENGGRGKWEACSYPWATVVVLPDGTVTPCLSLALGNLRDTEGDMDRILAGEANLRFREFIHRAGQHLPNACMSCCYLRMRKS